MKKRALLTLFFGLLACPPTQAGESPSFFSTFFSGESCKAIFGLAGMAMANFGLKKLLKGAEIHIKQELTTVKKEKTKDHLFFLSRDGKNKIFSEKDEHGEYCYKHYAPKLYDNFGLKIPESNWFDHQDNWENYKNYTYQLDQNSRPRLKSMLHCEYFKKGKPFDPKHSKNFIPIDAFTKKHFWSHYKNTDSQNLFIQRKELYVKNPDVFNPNSTITVKGIPSSISSHVNPNNKDRFWSCKRDNYCHPVYHNKEQSQENNGYQTYLISPTEKHVSIPNFVDIEEKWSEDEVIHKSIKEKSYRSAIIGGALFAGGIATAYTFREPLMNCFCRAIGISKTSNEL